MHIHIHAYTYTVYTHTCIVLLFSILTLDRICLMFMFFCLAPVAYCLLPVPYIYTYIYLMYIYVYWSVYMYMCIYIYICKPLFVWLLQAVRNETSFAQLADAADQSQSKLRNAVQESQGTLSTVPTRQYNRP